MLSSNEFDFELKFFVLYIENQNEEKFSQSLIIKIKDTNNKRKFKENLKEALKKLKKIFKNELRIKN